MTILAETPSLSPDGLMGPLGSSRRGWTIAAAFTMAAALLPALIWPGDISWMNDEAELIAQAWFGNHAHLLVQRGLAGNFSISYGPLPTQIYQLLLLITHDPIRLVELRAGLCAGVTAVSLLWLARSLDLNPWFAGAVVLAPYVWMFNRLMWDASFAMPLGALAIAAYAGFLRNRERRWLLLAGACILWLPLIHPQDLPLTAAVGGHMLWRERGALWKHRIGVLLVTALVIAFNSIYLRDVMAMLAERLTGQIQAGYPGATSRVPSFLAPLMAGRLLAGNMFAEVDAQLKSPPALAGLLEVAKLGSCVIFPLMWTGIAASIWPRPWRRIISSGEGNLLAEGKAPTLPSPRVPGQGTEIGPTRLTTLPHGTHAETHHDSAAGEAARDTMGGIAVSALVLQALLYGLMRVPAAPQYFFGSFAVDVLLAWLGVTALRRVLGLEWAAVGLYALCGAGITLSALWQTHQFGYPRNTHRPTLANQIQVAQELNRYSDITALTDVVPYLEFANNPKLLRCLRMFYPSVPGQFQTRSGRLMIRYASGPDGHDSRIELIEMADPFDVPVGARRIYVTPRSSR
jgi:hypothetical protein